MNKTELIKERVIIGKIVGVHGIKGTLKIHSFAESLEIFEPQTNITVSNPDGSEQVYEIDWIKPHARGALLALKHVNHRDQANALVGAELRIEKTALPELEAGVYYWYELIGLRVFTTDDRYLGQLESIIETGANDVYVVKEQEREILIPALASIVRLIDIDARIMRVELPEGLEEQ
ncbi:MAG: ribosome maturation factor RimM [Desulfobacterales bacterium]|nr:ribosome maturation factor RimM [Desulfobacterales bacterium]